MFGGPFIYFIKGRKVSGILSMKTRAEFCQSSAV